MSDTPTTTPEPTPAAKPSTRAKRTAPKAGAVVKLTDGTDGYAVVVGPDLVCRLGPAERHELETESVE